MLSVFQATRGQSMLTGRIGAEWKESRRSCVSVNFGKYSQQSDNVTMTGAEMMHRQCSLRAKTGKLL